MKLFTKLISMLVLLFFIYQYSSFGLDVFWSQELDKRWTPMAEFGEGVLFRQNSNEYDYKYFYINKSTGKSIWTNGNNDLALANPAFVPTHLINDRLVFFYDISKGYSCFDYVSGELKWRFNDKKLLNNNGALIADNKLFYYNQACDDKIIIYEIDVFKGGIKRTITLNPPYNKPADKNFVSLFLISIKNDCIYFTYGQTIQCYNTSENRYIWADYYDIYYNGMKYITDKEFIYSSGNRTENDKDFPDLEDYIIIGLDLKNGKELFSFRGSREFYVENGVIYYYSYEFWKKDTKYTKCIGAYSIDKLKDMYKYGSKTMYFRYNGFFNYSTGLIQFQDTPQLGIKDKVNIYDKYLNHVNSIELPFDLGKYYTTNTCLIGLREWRVNNKVQSYTIYCYNLPTNKMPDPPKKEVPKPVLGLIQWLIRYIIGRLKGLP